MRKVGKIITVGLSPAWDITCRGEGLDWGEHKQISQMSCRPAGKALNICRALAWMGTRSTAAGLWGRTDCEQMLRAIRPIGRFVKVKMTAVIGATRRNITIVDVANNREMHLRSRSELACRKALRKLKTDLDKMVNRNSVCVFAGSMPEGQLLDDVVAIINYCRGRGAKIAVDTSGVALKRIVDAGGVWLIKPNVEELGELLGERVKDNPASLAKAGRRLLGKVEVVLVSRGRKGAIVVTRKGAWRGQCAGRGKTLSTVGCGDYLLAGFLKGLKDKSNTRSTLTTAIKVATAKVWGWTERKEWTQVMEQIQVEAARM